MSYDSGHEIVRLSTKGSVALWQCLLKLCRRDKGVKTNNWLQGSKVKLPTIVHFIIGWARDLTSMD